MQILECKPNITMALILFALQSNQTGHQRSLLVLTMSKNKAQNVPNASLHLYLFLFYIIQTKSTVSLGKDLNFYACKSVSMGESKSLLGNRPPSRRSKHVQRRVRGSAPLVMTYQSDFYSRLSAIQFSFKVNELRATIITLKQRTSQEILIICECSD